MIPPQFDYHAPASLEEVLALLDGLNGPRVMSDGQSLLPTFRPHLASPTDTVVLSQLPAWF